METIKQLKELWASNKLKFIVALLPLLIIAFLKLSAWLIKRSADNLMEDTKEESNKLKAESDAANAQAEAHKAKAQALANQKPEIDEDWHKKK